MSSVSERQLAAQLHHSGTHRRRRDVSKRCRFDVCVRVAEFGIVPNVEGFHSERKPQPLPDRKSLEKGHIGVEQVRPSQDVPAGIAVGEDALRDVSRNRERRPIDTTEQVSGAAIVYRSLQEVGALRALRTGIRGIGIDRKAERRTALQGGDAVDLPSGERSLDEAVGSLETR